MSGAVSAALVVDGEASESDTEVERATGSSSLSTTKAFVISGEAPESDEEGALKVMKPTAEDDVSRASVSPPPSPSHVQHHSLLHRKLSLKAKFSVCPGENNVRLRASLEGLQRHTLTLAVAKLAASDKMLLSAQESLRSSNANLSLARARLKQVTQGLDRANCSAALPTVKLHCPSHA